MRDSRHFLVKYIMAMSGVGGVGICMSACGANAKGSHGLASYIYQFVGSTLT